MDNKEGDLKHDALWNEYTSLRSEIELAIQNQVRILGYGGTVLGVFAGLGVIRPSVLIIAALPFIAFFFSVLWSIEQTRMMRAGDYISFIEDRINKDRFEEPVVLWENWLRFRVENTPTRDVDIYQIHYFAQYAIISVFILIELIAIITVWVWPFDGLQTSSRIVLTVVYASFMGIMSYVLWKVVKHRDMSDSFHRLRGDITDEWDDSAGE